MGEGALDYGGGFLALAPALRQLRWPRKFRPSSDLSYDGTTNPREYLQLYSTMMVASGADAKIMANWFPMTLKSTARSWVMHLPEASIRSWPEFCERFVGAFQGGDKHLGTLGDLHTIIQTPDERLRSFMLRFSQASHRIPGAEDAAIIMAFSQNVRDPKMREKLSMRPVKTVHELYRLGNRCALAEEGRLALEIAQQEAVEPASSTKKKGSRKRGSRQVLASEPGAPAEGDKKAKVDDVAAEARPAAGPWCSYHESSQHDAKDCKIL